MITAITIKSLHGHKLTIGGFGPMNVFVGKPPLPEHIVMAMAHGVADFVGDAGHWTFRLSPEEGVHPEALKPVVNELRRYTQMFVTTQSPYFLDCFEADEVFCVAQGKSGKVYADRLDHHPDAPDMTKDFMSGEIWTSVYEQWVVPAGDRT